MEHIEPFARRAYDAVASRLDRIRAIGFIGCEIERDELMWALLPEILCTVMNHNKAMESYSPGKGGLPKRPDGSEHFCTGFIQDPDYRATQTEFSPEVLRFEYDSYSNGVKTFNDNAARAGMQTENRVSFDAGYPWRDFGDDDLAKIERIAQLQRSGDAPTELEKLMIAKYVKDGYALVENDRPRLLIPYIAKPECEQLFSIFDEIWAELTWSFFDDYIEGWAERFAREIPDFLPQNIRRFHKYNGAGMLLEVMTKLTDLGLLRKMTAAEAPRLGTFVWRYSE
jgi:hypothetical protein